MDEGGQGDDGIEDEALEVVVGGQSGGRHSHDEPSFNPDKLKLSYTHSGRYRHIWKTGWDAIGSPDQTKICIFS